MSRIYDIPFCKCVIQTFFFLDMHLSTEYLPFLPLSSQHRTPAPLYNFCIYCTSCVCISVISAQVLSLVMDSVKGLLMAYNQIIDTDLGKLEVIILKQMDFGKDWANEKCTFGKGWDSEKMLQLYIYDLMRKRELHDAAEIFAKEANLEMLQLVNSEEGLLTEWWNVFWPQFCSRMTNKAEEDPQSSAQSLMSNLLATLKISGAGRSEQPTTGNPHQSAVPTPVINHHLAKIQANDQMIGGGSSSVANQIVTTQITPVPPSGNASHLQMPVTLLPPPQVARVPNYDISGERSVQVESTCPAGQGSAYPPTAPNSGLNFTFTIT